MGRRKVKEEKKSKLSLEKEKTKKGKAERHQLRTE